MQPVLEIRGPTGFDLWPVAEVPPYGFLPLGGALTPAEVGTAVMAVAACNDIEPAADEPPRPTDPVRGFLHGLLTLDPLFAAGGLRVTDTATGVTLVPGCCNGMDERGDWQLVVDGGSAGFGHDPSPLAERLGDTVRLTVDAEAADSPRIDLPVTDLRRLLAAAEHDLQAFHGLASAWCATQLPDAAGELTEALARALAVPNSRESPSAE
ncbi:hypothetical protein RCO28_22395 [Streptomyces sp. LHD-70]|uniref:hypothetical protein n=1 Tax=Streptomyces sp. LHD-70 TaxID=3072140 RepID=UPI00280E7184|nr:hypothetical protein [Streptomyces sp. LHD-70]MDQ8705224.1 hypothetical protein [Streptomyces sp. LHD-70]